MTEPGSGRHLRVLTINALAPQYADGPRRRATLRDGLRALRPDIVAFQEVGLDEVGGLLDDDWYVAPTSRRTPDGLGATLAARWPIEPLREIDGGGSWYATLIAEVRAPIGLLVAHHKPVWPYGAEHTRERHAIAAARAVEDTLGGADRHVILLGDLDAAPDAASVRFLTGRQSLAGTGVCYQDAWTAVRPGDPGPTFTPDNPLVRDGDMPCEPGRRIDYILVRCTAHGPTLQVAGCERVFTDHAHPVSDHYGVLADLHVPPRPPGTFAAGRAPGT